jgi:hypothetical protein
MFSFYIICIVLLHCLVQGIHISFIVWVLVDSWGSQDTCTMAYFCPSKVGKLGGGPPFHSLGRRETERVEEKDGAGNCD